MFWGGFFGGDAGGVQAAAVIRAPKEGRRKSTNPTRIKAGRGEQIGCAAKPRPTGWATPSTRLLRCEGDASGSPFCAPSVLFRSAFWRVGNAPAAPFTVKRIMLELFRAGVCFGRIGQSGSLQRKPDFAAEGNRVRAEITVQVDGDKIAQRVWASVAVRVRAHGVAVDDERLLRSGVHIRHNDRDKRQKRRPDHLIAGHTASTSLSTLTSIQHPRSPTLSTLITR